MVVSSSCSSAALSAVRAMARPVHIRAVQEQSIASWTSLASSTASAMKVSCSRCSRVLQGPGLHLRELRRGGALEERPHVQNLGSRNRGFVERGVRRCLGGEGE